MKLLKATQQDLAYCAKLSIVNMTPYYERWGEIVLSEAQWFQVASAYDTYLIVPDVGDKPVGFVSLQIDPADPKALFVADFHTEHSVQNDSTIDKLEPIVVGLMRKAGATSITGSIHRDNPIVFSYEKRGYHKVGITPTRYTVRKDFTAEQLQEI